MHEHPGKVRPPRLLRLVWLLAFSAAVVAAPAAAWAGPAVKVFPLTSAKEMPAGLEGTPERLTAVVAKMAGGKVADAPIQRAAQAAGCTIDDSSCLDRLARASRVEELVFGTIRVGDDLRVFVKLTRFMAGTERRERTFVLTSETPAALAKQLARSARDMFDQAPGASGEDDVEEPEPPRSRRRPPAEGTAELGEKRPEREPGERPRRRLDETLEEEEAVLAGDSRPVRREARGEGGGEGRGEAGGGDGGRGEVDGPVDAPAPARRGRVTRGTYFLIAGGVVAAAVGTGLAIAASSLREDARRARRDTPDDAQRIAAIDRAVRIRATTGTVLLVGGGLAIAGGVVRALLQRRPVDADRTVSVVPVEGGGAALVLSGIFR